MKVQFIIGFFIILSLLSCSNDETPEIFSDDELSLDDTLDISADAQLFLNEVLDIMEANSINRYKIDWTEFRNRVFERVGGAQTLEETYVGIKTALILLGDNHSFFRKPDGSSFSSINVSDCTAESIPAFTIPENIGYVKVKRFGSTDSLSNIGFARDIQNQIRAADHSNILGWIIDLSGNSGGNMWPMLAGIGPILGEGIAGYFIDPDPDINPISWGYSSGSSVINGSPVTQLENPYELINPNPKVVVLLDEAVMSSGEAIAISFIGRENAISMGSSTCGLSTSNSLFYLSDNSALILTTHYMADRNKIPYGVPIIPNNQVDNENVIEWAVLSILN